MSGLRTSNLPQSLLQWDSSHSTGWLLLLFNAFRSEEMLLDMGFITMVKLLFLAFQILRAWVLQWCRKGNDGDSIELHFTSMEFIGLDLTSNTKILKICDKRFLLMQHNMQEFDS